MSRTAVVHERRKYPDWELKVFQVYTPLYEYEIQYRRRLTTPFQQKVTELRKGIEK
jgi:hypothetical protein